MPMLRISRAALVAAAAVFVAALPAGAQQDYPQTLYWGAGLIDIPVAWVAPLSGDFTINYSGKILRVDASKPKLNYNDKINSQLSFSMSAFGRAEVGISAFSSNPEQGFFATGLLLREDDFRGKGGAGRFLPSIAVGVRNVGPYRRIDRFGIGYNLLPPTAQDPNATHVADSLHTRFNTANTVFGVATKGFSLSDIRPNWPDVNLSFTAGYGNGLFKDDGGLGPRYSGHSTGGLFYGVKTDFAAAPSVLVSLMAENNAWDYNLGASVLWRGIRGGLYITEVAGKKTIPDTDPASALYNYSKVAFVIGWQSNIFALLRGDFLSSRAALLERQRQELLAEITRRQQRIAALELEINRYEAQNLLELEQRRAQAEAELRQEREALKRLEDRLKRVEQQNPNTPTTPPPTPRR